MGQRQTGKLQSLARVRHTKMRELSVHQMGNESRIPSIQISRRSEDTWTKLFIYLSISSFWLSKSCVTDASRPVETSSPGQEIALCDTNFISTIYSRHSMGSKRRIDLLTIELKRCPLNTQGEEGSEAEQLRHPWE